MRELGGCLGLTGPFTIVGDFFGYASAPPWETSPTQDDLPQQLSLLEQVRRIQQPHFNLHLVRVGTVDGLLDPPDEENVDCAVQLARDIYAAIGVGIGRVDRWWQIPSSAESGFDVIDDDCEADELIDAYDLPDNGIKIFFVTAWLGSGTIGRTDGDEDGCVVLLRSGAIPGTSADFLGTGRTLAHELGHMFSLGHENDDTSNLMCQTGNLSDAEKADPIPATTGFTHGQAEDVKEDEEWVRGPC